MVRTGFSYYFMKKNNKTNLWNETDMNVSKVVVTNFELKLPERFNEMHALNISNSSSQLQRKMNNENLKLKINLKSKQQINIEPKNKKNKKQPTSSTLYVECKIPIWNYSVLRFVPPRLPTLPKPKKKQGVLLL